MGGAEKVEIEHGIHSLSNRVKEAVQAIIDFVKREGPKGWDDPWNWCCAFCHLYDFHFCLLFLLRFSIFNSLYMLEAADFILSAEVVGILWWVNKWTLCKAIQHCRVFGINIFRILHFCFYNHCIAWWFGLWVCVTLIALMNLILILLIIKMFNLLHTLEMLNPLKSFEVIHWKFWNLRPNCHFSWVFNY